MNIIKRNNSSDNGTFGEFIIDGEHFCWTLERPETGDHPCIPKGTYPCNWFDSPHNDWCYLLEGTEPRTMIEIHRANIYTELRGCIALGLTLGTYKDLPAVLQSGKALEALHNKLGDSFELTIQ